MRPGSLARVLPSCWIFSLSAEAAAEGLLSINCRQETQSTLPVKFLGANTIFQILLQFDDLLSALH